MITYISGSFDLLDLAEPLWVKLIEHHKIRSVHFRHEFELINFEIRKRMLEEKAGEGIIMVDLAQDSTTGRVIGYCFNTINQVRRGEIESIFVEEGFRNQGIGDTLVKRALAWMEEQGTYERIVTVASGNDDVLDFYARYGFVPRQRMLKQI